MSKLKKNLFFNIIYQILILFLPLVTSSYLAKVVGAEGIGRYSYAYSVALYFTYFTVLGLQKYGNRVIASVQNDKVERSKNFFEIYIMQAICFAICIVIYIVYCSFLAGDKTIAFVMMVFVFSSLFDINWFFFGMEMFDKTVIRNTLVKVITTILIFVMVKTRNDVDKYAMIMSLGYLVSQLSLWPYLRKLVVKTKIEWKGIKKHFLPNLIMFLPVIAVSVYKIMDKIMLGLMSTKEIVGYYENAEKIINVPIAVVTALGTVMLPRVTALVSEKKDTEVSKFRDSAVLIVTAFTVAACFGIIGVADILSVWMWGKDFLMSGDVMKYLSVTLVFLGIGNVVRTQFLIPYKYDKIYIISAFLGAIINVIVNAILIPHYGAIGAAIGTICAEMLVCFYQLFMTRKELPLLKYLKNIIAFSIDGFIMFWVITIIPSFDSLFLTLVIKILVGVVVYVPLAGLFLFKKNR